jgi:hypothetical protein
MKTTALIILILLGTIPIVAQSTTGELRLTVTDPAGRGLKSSVELVSEGNEYRQAFTTDGQGKLDAKRLVIRSLRACGWPWELTTILDCHLKRT